jgi:two-component system sensor histidine kinase RegB
VTLRARVEGTRLSIEVADRGAGMAPTVLERAGEPFFTTKPPGRGMGLGLFLTRTVVERLGGQLSLESSAGQGTRARIALPVDELQRAETPA